MKQSRRSQDVSTASRCDDSLLNRCSEMNDYTGETRENGQYPTEEDDRRGLQSTRQTARDGRNVSS